MFVVRFSFPIATNPAPTPSPVRAHRSRLGQRSAACRVSMRTRWGPGDRTHTDRAFGWSRHAAIVFSPQYRVYPPCRRLPGAICKCPELWMCLRERKKIYYIWKSEADYVWRVTEWVLTSATNACTAVHHNGRTAGMPRPCIAESMDELRLLITHLLQKVQHGHSWAGNAVVRPAGELPMWHIANFVSLFGNKKTELIIFQ